MPVRTPFKRISWLTILISFNVALLILNSIALWKLYFYEQPQATVWNIITKQPPAPSLIDYKDFVSIMLAGLSLMITVLGIGLATIAVWGYGTIRDEARLAAVRKAETVAKTVARDVAKTVLTRESFGFTKGVDAEMVTRLAEALSRENENGTSESDLAPEGPERQWPSVVKAPWTWLQGIKRLRP